MKSNSDNLLLDLIALLRRYSTKEWMQLSDFIENDKTRAAIVLFLREMAALNQAPRRVPATNLKDKDQRKKDQRDKRKHDKRAKEATTKEQLELELARSSISDLRTMAQKVGAPSGPKDSKQRLIRRLIQHTVKRAPAKRMLPVGSQNRDYDRWADIILGQGRKPDRS